MKRQRRRCPIEMINLMQLNIASHLLVSVCVLVMFMLILVFNLCKEAFWYLPLINRVSKILYHNGIGNRSSSANCICHIMDDCALYLFTIGYLLVSTILVASFILADSQTQAQHGTRPNTQSVARDVHLSIYPNSIIFW